MANVLKSVCIFADPNLEGKGLSALEAVFF